MGLTRIGRKELERGARSARLIAIAGMCHLSAACDQRVSAQSNSARSATVQKPENAAKRSRDPYQAALAKDSARRDSIFMRMGKAAGHLGRLSIEIAEYHDEQRLVVAGKEYGPMAYIFGSPYLAGFTSMTQIRAHGNVGHFVAVVFIDTAQGSKLPTEYTRLNLVPGVNCVYVSNTTRDSTTHPNKITWQAHVVPGDATGDCIRPTPTTPIGTALTVMARRDQDPAVSQSAHNNPAQTDFPGVARFDEARDGQPLLGVRCLNAWCQIGPTNGFLPRFPSHSAVASLATRLEGRVQAWHDDQMLSVVDNATGRLVPRIRATITPRQGLDSVSEESYRQWRDAAIIWLKDDPRGTTYQTKWGMRQGMNLLELKRTGNNWEGRVTPFTENASTGGKVMGTATAVHVEHMFHPDVAVPATARFRWRMNDEGAWVNCDQGCCRVDAIL